MRALPSLCCLLLLTSATAVAGPLYKWKDANGVTQYSERPPEGQKYETRRITSNGDPVVEAEPAKAEESPQCASARNNLKLLAGSGPVMQDTDGDGKPDAELDEAQRAAQKQLAEAAAAVYCK
ncbi:conserved exported hypothetical protein [uncultured Stenotrophomonas sp.]|uniref:DUF4124 domain-containing protein n=1 Tax=uncultured Stenotrophomonas sp. TaxID=165438 RepID=A0A1Y5Q9W8_9GAMM|nr:conserved exported hypothetical protein [uncultured Stenotrophomonas sp.]